MAEDYYPRYIRIGGVPAFETSHLYAVGDVIHPTTPNGHVYMAQTGGMSNFFEPAWGTGTKSVTTSLDVQFVEHGTYPGVRHNTYIKHALDWKAITLESTYEDQGFDTNRSADAPAQRWTLIYLVKSEAAAAVLDAFWDAHKLEVPFTFVEPRRIPHVAGLEGQTHTGVYFEEYIDDGFDEKIWKQKRTVRLIKPPTSGSSSMVVPGTLSLSLTTFAPTLV